MIDSERKSLNDKCATERGNNMLSESHTNSSCTKLAVESRLNESDSTDDLADAKLCMIAHEKPRNSVKNFTEERSVSSLEEKNRQTCVRERSIDEKHQIENCDSLNQEEVAQIIEVNCNTRNNQLDHSSEEQAQSKDSFIKETFLENTKKPCVVDEKDTVERMLDANDCDDEKTLECRRESDNSKHKEECIKKAEHDSAECSSKQNEVIKVENITLEVENISSVFECASTEIPQQIMYDGAGDMILTSNIYEEVKDEVLKSVLCDNVTVADDMMLEQVLCGDINMDDVMLKTGLSDDAGDLTLKSLLSDAADDNLNFEENDFATTWGSNMLSTSKVAISCSHEDIIGEKYQCNDETIDGIRESEFFCLEQEMNESECMKESMSNGDLIICEDKGWKDCDDTTGVKSKEIDNILIEHKDGVGKQEAMESSNIETDIVLKDIDFDNLPEEAGEDACDFAQEFYGLSTSVQEVKKISSYIPDDAMNSILTSQGDNDMIVDEQDKHHTPGDEKDITKDVKENRVLSNKDTFVDYSVQLMNVADCLVTTEESVKHKSAVDSQGEANSVNQKSIQAPLENEKTQEKDDDSNICEENQNESTLDMSKCGIFSCSGAEQIDTKHKATVAATEILSSGVQKDLAAKALFSLISDDSIQRW